MRKTYHKPKFEPRTSHPSPDAIRQLRADCGLTQAGLAQLLEVSIHSVEKWEGGSKMPRPVWRLFQLLAKGDNHELDRCNNCDLNHRTVD